MDLERNSELGSDTVTADVVCRATGNSRESRCVQI